MVISNEYRYLFIEVPLTGSWSIRNELCQYYGGTAISHKHAIWPDFRHSFTRDEGSNFVFATVRHPMDEVVSIYYKLLSNHKGLLDSPESLSRLRASATTPYWRGRNLKAYMASTLWNLKSRRWSTSISRTLYTGLALVAAGPSLLNRDFWQAMKDSQVPATADRAMERHRAEVALATTDTP